MPLIISTIGFPQKNAILPWKSLVVFTLSSLSSESLTPSPIELSWKDYTKKERFYQNKCIYTVCCMIHYEYFNVLTQSLKVKEIILIYSTISVQECILSPILSKHETQSKNFCQDKTFYFLGKARQTLLWLIHF